MPQQEKDDRTCIVRLETPGAVEEYLASAPGTRRIANDPMLLGVEYTLALRQSCADVLRADSFGLVERETHVLNILRGGLNFGLREALHLAFGWNRHATDFLSAQRTNGADGWRIDESSYRKLSFAGDVSLVLGDVVATGTSLRHALGVTIERIAQQGAALRRIVLFTFGGERATDVLVEMDERCRRIFPGYDRSVVVYFEGRFRMATEETPLTIRIPETDLVRRDATLAPEFVESQYEDPAFPIERCAIYDAGSRAFLPDEHLADVADYWRQTLALARTGVTYAQLLAERFPGLDPRRFGSVDLVALCERRLAAIVKLTQGKETH